MSAESEECMHCVEESRKKTERQMVGRKVMRPGRIECVMNNDVMGEGKEIRVREEMNESGEEERRGLGRKGVGEGEWGDEKRGGRMGR